MKDCIKRNQNIKVAKTINKEDIQELHFGTLALVLYCYCRDKK